MQNFEDNSQVIVTRGSKTLARDTEVTVLGYDGLNDTYAVKLPDGGVKMAKASALGQKPERTFTRTEVLSALNEALHYGESRDAVTRVAQNLGIGQLIDQPGHEA